MMVEGSVHDGPILGECEQVDDVDLLGDSAVERLVGGSRTSPQPGRKRGVTYKTPDELKCALETLLRELRGSNAALPVLRHVSSHQKLFSHLDLVSLAFWIGHPTAGDLAKSPCRAILESAIESLGFAAPKASTATIACLRDEAHRALIRNPAVDLLTEIDVLQKLMRLSDDDPLCPLVQPRDILKTLIVPRLARIDDPLERARIEAGWSALGDLVHEMVATGVPPSTFADCLQVLVDARGLSLPKLAEEAGTHVRNLRRLLSGTPPRADIKDLVQRLEQALGAVPDTLLSLVEAPRLRLATDDVYNDEIRLLLKVAGCDASFLPADWPDLDENSRVEIVEWVRHTIIGATPSRRLARYRFGKDGAHTDRSCEKQLLSPIMAAEVATLIEFKTAPLPTTLAFPRQKRARGNGFRVTHGGKWRATTARHASGYIRRTVAAVDQLTGGRAWHGGQGLGFLVHPGLQLAVSEHIAKQRFSEMEMADAFRQLNYPKPKDELVFAQSDALRLETLMGLFSPVTGFFFHQPPALAPIPGLVDAAWVDLARREWQMIIKNSLVELRSLADTLADEAKTIRDTWLPILPILEMDCPLLPVLKAIDRMEDDRPDGRGMLRTMAHHDRSHLLMSMLVHGKLRRANYSKLTWRADNTGNLRWNRCKRHWSLVIAQSDMKNAGSGALPDDGADLTLVLDPNDPRLYKSIERWIGTVDPATGIVDQTGSSRRLMRGANSDFLFPGKRSNRGLNEQSISKVVMNFSARYLVGCPWHQDGIDGVLPFGTHAIRDIVATHYLKTTGSIEEAARALFDVPETLKLHYARFTSEERSKRSNAIMRNTTQQRFA